MAFEGDVMISSSNSAYGSITGANSDFTSISFGTAETANNITVPSGSQPTQPLDGDRWRDTGGHQWVQIEGKAHRYLL